MVLFALGLGGGVHGRVLAPAQAVDLIPQEGCVLKFQQLRGFLHLPGQALNGSFPLQLAHAAGVALGVFGLIADLDAVRNAEGMVIMYADVVTDSMERAITETERRRAIQMAYNEEHGIVPKTIVKAIADSTEMTGSNRPVGRMTCCATCELFRRSYSPGVAETKIIWLSLDSTSSNFRGRLSKADGRSGYW